MIAFLNRRIAESPAAQDILQGVLTVGTAGTGIAIVEGWIDVASVVVKLLLGIVALVVSVISGLNLYYKYRQNKFNFEQSVKYDGEDRRSK